MREMMHDPATTWLAAGAIIIAIEACTAPGLGLFLAGLGAIGTGLILKAGMVGEEATPIQFACCFGLTALWTLLLWKPLKHFRTRRANAPRLESNNLIGEVAIVGPGGLQPARMGQVIWSGTPMNAELDLNASPLPEGAKVRIITVYGNTLKVEATL